MSRTDVSAGGWRDLVLAGGLTVLAAVVAIFARVQGSAVAPELLVWALAIPFFTILPGYALVSALFPERPITFADGRSGGGDASGPSWLVRVATSLVASVLVVAVVGVVLSATVGIDVLSAVVGVAAPTLVCLVVAGWRRSAYPASRRAAPLARHAGVWRGLGATSLQRGALLVALLVLVSAVTAATVYPASEDAYTEFYLLEETEDGELVAADFPSSVAVGENVTVHLGIENTGSGSQTYDVVSRAIPDGATESAERLDRFQIDVDGGDRAVLERTVTPRRAANRTQLQFLLFEDGVPAEPTAERADASLRLWVEVRPGGDG